jgi:transposase
MPSILPDPSNLILEKVTHDERDILIFARSRRPDILCPKCRAPARRIHSRYLRTIRDISWAGLPVRIHLKVRKFFCDTPGCAFHIFAEQLPELVARYGRRTVRLEERLADLGLAFGGNPAARLSRRFDVSVSRWTVLRVARKQKPPTPPTPKRLGIDDFAFRRGYSYGTILVDLDRHRPVELLPDRTTQTVREWLASRSGIRIITRDRSTAYAEAASLGAPGAEQVADRWHLLDNATRTLREVLVRMGATLRRAVRKLNSQLSPEPKQISKPKDVVRKARSAAREGRIARKVEFWNDVRDLHAKGQSFREIARRLGSDRKTVKKYALSETFPEMARYPVRPKLIDGYTDHIDQRWRDGCYRITLLLKEIHALGYRGHRGGVQRYCHEQWGGRPLDGALPKVIPTPSARELGWWLLLPEESLDEDQLAVREAVMEESPEIAKAATLTRRFHSLVRKRNAKAYDKWVADAESSEVKEMVGFVKGLVKDDVAVRNAIRRKWSNGQVEGQVNRLKLIKRQMFGRAKFDLLRLRVLYQG